MTKTLKEATDIEIKAAIFDIQNVIAFHQGRVKEMIAELSSRAEKQAEKVSEKKDTPEVAPQTQ